MKVPIDFLLWPKVPLSFKDLPEAIDSFELFGWRLRFESVGSYTFLALSTILARYFSRFSFSSEFMFFFSLLFFFAPLLSIDSCLFDCLLDYLSILSIGFSMVLWFACFFNSSSTTSSLRTGCSWNGTSAVELWISFKDWEFVGSNLEFVTLPPASLGKLLQELISWIWWSTDLSKLNLFDFEIISLILTPSRHFFSSSDVLTVWFGMHNFFIRIMLSLSTTSSHCFRSTHLTLCIS